MCVGLDGLAAGIRGRRRRGVRSAPRVRIGACCRCYGGRAGPFDMARARGRRRRCRVRSRRRDLGDRGAVRSLPARARRRRHGRRAPPPAKGVDRARDLPRVGALDLGPTSAAGRTGDQPRERRVVGGPLPGGRRRVPDRRDGNGRGCRARRVIGAGGRRRTDDHPRLRGGTAVVIHRMHDDDRAGRAHHGDDGAHHRLEEAQLDRGSRPGARTRTGHGRPSAQGRVHHRVLERERRRDGHEDGQRGVVVAELAPVLATALALVQVATQRSSAERRAAHRPQLQADLVAVGLASGARGHERLAGLEDEGLDLGPRHLERERDLVVAESSELCHDQRGALVGREPAQVDDQVPQLLAPLDDDRRLLADAVRRLGHGDLAASAEQGVAAVARDRVQPRAQVNRLLAAHDPVIGGEERVLERVLSLVAVAQEVGAEAEDGAMMTVVERLEGGRASCPHEGNQLGVGGQSQKGRRCAPTPRARRPRWHRCSFHGGHYSHTAAVT
jgi:hypothetical protein